MLYKCHLYDLYMSCINRTDTFFLQKIKSQNFSRCNLPSLSTSGKKGTQVFEQNKENLPPAEICYESPVTAAFCPRNNGNRRYFSTICRQPPLFFWKMPVYASILLRVTWHFSFSLPPMRLYRGRNLDESSARVNIFFKN